MDKSSGKKQGNFHLIFKAALILIPALIYVPTFGGNAAVPIGQSAYSDLLITHYPYIYYLRDSILSHHQIPLWSTLIQSGSPFAANPLAGLFYLPGWLAMLFPLPAGLSLNMAAHVVLGSWGMYLFMRQKEIGETGSLLGALGFGLMPKLAAHFGAGHVSLIYAISWTPWLFYLSEKEKKGWTTGIIAGAIFLADPRWSIYTGAFWLSYDIAHRQLLGWRRVYYYLRASLIAFLMSAPLIIPLFEYLKHATRSELSAGDILTGSLPVENLMGLIIPGSGGNTEWYFYTGGVLLGLFLSQLFIKKLRKINLFWITWLVVSLLLSMGYWGISAEWISKIPILNMLRVPARSLFIAGICFPIIAGNSLDWILKDTGTASSQKMVHFGIIISGSTLLAGVAIITKAQPLMALWGFAFFILFGFILLFKGKISAKYLSLLIMGLLIGDLLGAGLQAYDIQDEAIREPDLAHEYLIKDNGIFRIYSPSYSVPQHLAAEYRLELVDGVDPMQVAKYVDFAEDATGVPQKKYSVTIPPFATGNPHLDNLNADPDAGLLGLLNAKYILSEFLIKAPGLRLLSSGGTRYVYLNDEVMPRAWVEKNEGNPDNWDRSDFGKANIIERTPNSILLEAEGPGTLVLSEVHYPGWRVYIDGQRTEIQTSYDILRSVLLDEGPHEIAFKFRPFTVYAGLCLAGMGWILLVVLYVRKEE